MLNIKNAIAAAACAVAVVAGAAAPAIAADDFDYYYAETTGDWTNVPNWKNPADVEQNYKNSPEAQQDARRQQQAQQQGQAQQQANPTVFECENMAVSGQYAAKVPGGVALFANNECVSFNNYFANDTHDITIKGHSRDGRCARVDLYIGGQFVKSYFWEGTYNAECTYKGLHHVTGNQEVRLVCADTNNSFDVEVDSIRFDNGRNTGMTAGNENNNEASYR